ncbi:MAG TPA: family 20 glycosylhydrolase [Kofleriaceae bacterium]|nr:family 20 glycosylhydrolase [Kofleriaceae bacterium]
MKRFTLPVLVCGIALSGCDGGATGDLVGRGDPVDIGRGGEADDRVAAEPANVSVEWRPVDHSAGGAFFRSELTIENHGPGALGAAGWHLYFSFVRRVLDDGQGDDTAVQDLAGQGIRIAKADVAGSGDFDVLEPLADFTPIGPGERRSFTVLAEAWAILRTDAPAGFHIAFDGEAAGAAAFVPATASIDASDPRQTTRFDGDVAPVETPALRHADNPPRRELGLADRLLPTPRRVEPGSGHVTLRGHLVIEHPRALASEAAYLASALDDVLAGSVALQEADDHHRAATIRLAVDPDLDIDCDGSRDAEAYLLDVKGGQIRIRGSDAAGVFHGIQTLRQLVPVDADLAAADREGRPGEITLPEVHIADAPGFVYRGMHLDVARHFQPKETVEKLLDLMAYYKLNKLHLHLTDDEGWRLEIPGIPELTSFGARRGHDRAELDMLHVGLGSGNDLEPGDGIAAKPVSEADANGGVAPTYQGFETATVNFVGEGDGYYTARDFEEILAYATERHIDVIPEIDVPGHARAAVLAMEHRHRVLEESDPVKASEFRLFDPDDTSIHTSVQGYTDNFANPCLDSTYAFLTAVVAEIEARYDAVPGARLVAIHGGGDELPGLAANTWWQGSPACQANPATRGMTDPELFDLFFTRWNQIITATGAEMTGWDDIIHGGLALDGFVPMPWSNVWGWGREDDAYRYANQGYRVVLSHATNLYMDLAYGKDPDEPGYYWANFVDEKKTFEYRPFDIYANATHDRMGNPIDPSTWDGKERLTEAGKANILGMHGLLWGENLKTPELLEYFAFPKLLGVAERAWNPEPAEPADMPESWARFASRLGQEVLPRLGAYRAVDLRGELPDAIGVNYRIPPPGSVITGGTLRASVRFPGLPIEYSIDDGTTWVAYAGPVAVSGRVALRTRAPDGRSSRIAWVE